MRRREFLASLFAPAIGKRPSNLKFYGSMAELADCPSLGTGMAFITCEVEKVDPDHVHQPLSRELWAA